jgi:hypothetical protein
MTESIYYTLPHKILMRVWVISIVYGVHYVYQIIYERRNETNMTLSNQVTIVFTSIYIIPSDYDTINRQREYNVRVMGEQICNKAISINAHHTVLYDTQYMMKNRIMSICSRNYFNCNLHLHFLIHCHFV